MKQYETDLGLGLWNNMKRGYQDYNELTGALHALVSVDPPEPIKLGNHTNTLSFIKKKASWNR